MSYRNIVANQQYHFADLKTLMVPKLHRYVQAMS